MNVSVLGLGYVGLPTAALLAQAGHCVSGYDTAAAVRERLRAKDVEGHEAEVREIVMQALESGRLRITNEVAPADAYILCVPTPTVDRKPDLRYVEAAAADAARVAARGSIIALESTVPPGATERILESAISAAGKDPSDFRIAHCPERVLPGAIVRELRGNARVIGGRAPGDAQAVRDLYATFVDATIHTTSTTVAEFVKVLENTYRDVNIAFANEIAILSEHLGIDAWEAIALANEHPRVNILSPGPGVGGHCIPVDPVFLSNANPFVTELIQSARRINERMPYLVAQRIGAMLPKTSYHPKVALLGAAYKANVGDTRESPCARIDALLREHGMLTAIYDPHVAAFSGPLSPTIEAALDGADACVLVTDHREFAALDPVHAAALMRGRLVVDTRHILDLEAWRACGFTGYVLGQGGTLRPIEAVA